MRVQRQVLRLPALRLGRSEWHIELRVAAEGQRSLGSRYPTLATKTKTSQRWGTRHPRDYVGTSPLEARSSKHLNGKEETMSEHHDSEKGHEAHALHEEAGPKGPHDPKQIKGKMASDVAYWSKELGISGEKLHELIRSHGTHVDKIRAAIHSHKS
jgi:hypothetical protein